MEKDTMLRARMTAEQMQVLDKIVQELQREMPEANVSTSSLARYALERYVDDYIAKRDKTRIIINTSVAGLSHNDIKALQSYIADLVEKAKSDGNLTVANVLIDFDIPIMNLVMHLSRP